MEDLLRVVERSLSVDGKVGNKPIDHRKTLFKSSGRGKVENIKEARRFQLLEDYKRKRDTLVNEKRGLLIDEFNDNDEDWMEWNETKTSHRKRWYNKNCKNQLMLSEWLLDYPQDLETNWTCVLCPEGRRCLVVAKSGCTRSYNKAGMLVAKFKSILSNGNPSLKSKHSGLFILDCIWLSKTKQLFALDVLHWNNQKLLDCDAQFRLYWLKSKLTELRQSSSAKPLGDVCDIFLPPHCSLSQLPDTLREQDPSQVDGILFYHNQAPYISGQTPLVGWLKPYMLEERFGVKVTEEYLSSRPDTYVNLEQWVASVSHEHRRHRKNNKREVGMDCSSNLDSDVSGSVFEMEEEPANESCSPDETRI